MGTSCLPLAFLSLLKSLNPSSNSSVQKQENSSKERKYWELQAQYFTAIFIVTCNKSWPPIYYAIFCIKSLIHSQVSSIKQANIKNYVSHLVCLNKAPYHEENCVVYKVSTAAIVVVIIIIIIIITLIITISPYHDQQQYYLCRHSHNGHLMRGTLIYFCCSWIPACAQILIEERQEWMHLVPNSEGDSTVLVQQFFACLAALMSTQLRSLVINSLADFVSFLSFYKVTPVTQNNCI